MRTRITVSVDSSGTQIKGQIIYLHKNEVRVEILEPSGGVTAGCHHFFGKNGPEPYVDDSGNLTREGKRAVSEKLKELHHYCELFEKRVVELKRDYDPVRLRLDKLYDAYKKGVGAEDQQTRSLELILWLNHEFYKNACEAYPEIADIGMDTFIQLVSKHLVSPSGGNPGRKG